MCTIIPDSSSTLSSHSALGGVDARRTAAAAVLSDYKAALASAPVTSPPGASGCCGSPPCSRDLLDVLGVRPETSERETDGRPTKDDFEPSCSAVRRPRRPLRGPR